MEIIIACIVLFFLFFIEPFFYFIGGWISGWLIKITIGNLIVSGLSLIGFNLPLDSFPLFFGTLSVIASFFHTHITYNSRR